MAAGTATEVHPLITAVLEQIDAAEEHVAVRSGPAPAGWQRVADLDQPALADLVARVRAGEAAGRLDVAGAYASAWLAEGLIGPSAAALAVHGVAWRLAPARTAVRLHADGWVDGIAIASAVPVVGADHPAAGQAGVEVVAGRGTLCDVLAGSVVGELDRLFGLLRPLVRFGLPGMWGGVADVVLSSAVWHARRTGSDQEGAAAAADALLDALAAAQRRLRVRPTWHAIDVDGTAEVLCTKGTCCTYYKAYDGTPDPEGDGYCGTCPFRTPASREARLRGWLQESSAT